MAAEALKESLSLFRARGFGSAAWLKNKGGAGAIGQINAILGGHRRGVEIFHATQSERAKVTPGAAFDFGKKSLIVMEEIKCFIGHQQR